MLLCEDTLVKQTKKCCDVRLLALTSSYLCMFTFTLDGLQMTSLNWSSTACAAA